MTAAPGGRTQALQVCEIYAAIQGESSFAGWPCVLVRLAGCPLRCRYCDSTYAQTGGREQSLDEITGLVRACGLPLVEITGGEPLAQAPVFELIRALLDEHLQVLIETGGGVSIAGVDPRAWIILDVKTPGSGMAARQDPGNLARLRPHDEVKYVLCSRADYEWAREHVGAHDLAARHVVHFSPAGAAEDEPGQGLAPQDLATWILADRLPVRLNLQLHRLLWGAGRRGV